MNEYEGKIILWSSSAGHRSPTSYEKTFLARAKHEGQLFFSIIIELLLISSVFYLIFQK